MNSIAPNQASTVTLSGYQIDELIFDGNPTRIYRARRESDGVPVMLKSAHGELSVRDFGISLKHEFEIARRFSVPGVIQVFALENYRNIPVIVMEDFGGTSLDHLAKQQSFSLAEILQIAISTVQGLAEIHAQNIIHKDITPANLVYNQETRELKIIDFGISSYLTREQAAIANPKFVESSLPYLSPEQTGRMNRSIDYRTDYYSLGATLYELLTGSKLFNVNEAVEWFHCHIAKKPITVFARNDKVPKAVSDIVMKLLEKMAEDRYQSAWGIKADLQRCLDQLTETGKIEPFDLAQADIPNRFHIPQRLYGREQEIEKLLHSFDRASKGGKELILVSGYSGIGKSCLIKEIYKPVTERRGNFISGKFDQLHRNVPYSALAAALQDLIRQLLTETEEQLSDWREKIVEVLGSSGQLITNLIPELELIIGPQPAVSPLPALESELRFHRIFYNFIRLFSNAEHPLVLFLDDLQWADTASMKIIEMLVNPDYSASHLVVIGSYRDNEITHAHALNLLLKDMRENDGEIVEIKLQPLSKSDLTALIADTLFSRVETVAPLAKLVLMKTAGNPFFTEEFLKFLYRENLLRYNHEHAKWEWDLDVIYAQQMTDNVVELMADKLSQLPRETLQLLKTAASIGNTFCLRILAIVSGIEMGETVDALKAAMAEGVVAPISDASQLLDIKDDPKIDIEFAFAHDRIQQAAYSLFSDESRCQTHLNIGRLLLRGLSKKRREEQLFEIVNHLNLGEQLINDAEERSQLYRLNIEAGQQAKSSTAYEAAISCFETALRLLPRNAWQTDYQTVMDLYVSAAESAALNLAYDTMEELLGTAYAHSTNVLDEGRLSLVEVAALQAQGKLMQAVNKGKEALAKLGHNYPRESKQHHVILKLIQIARHLRNADIDELKNLPLMTDQRHQVANAIGTQIGRAAMFIEPKLLPMMVLKSILIQLQEGHSPEGVSAWAAYGMILAAELGQPERGIEYGKLAIALAEKYNMKSRLAVVHHIYNAMIRHWQEPLVNTLGPLHEAHRLGLENGDFEYATLAIAVRQINAFCSAQQLDSWWQDTLQYQETIKPLKQGMTSDYLDLCLQLHDNLTGKASDPKELVGEYYDIVQKQNDHEQAGDLSFMVINAEFSILLKYLFGDYSSAFECISTLRTHVSGHGGFYRCATATMLESLVLLANFSAVRAGQRRKLLVTVKRNQKRMKIWAKHCPENFQNKYELIKAEKLRRSGRELEASDAFEKSMVLSSEQGFIQEQAIAAELCGQMHWEAGRKTLADPYLTKARDLYQAWGATAKVHQLETVYPQLIRAVGKNIASSTTTTLVNFDITALTKALKAIADEKIHSRMIQVIIESSVQFAGAENGVLVLRNADDELCIEGEFSLQNGMSNILSSASIEDKKLPQVLINYVARTYASVVVHDAQQPSKDIVGLESDVYIQKNQVRSILCCPIVSGTGEKGELIGLIYLENNLVCGAFTQERFDILEIIGMAAAGRLELSRKAAFDGLTGLFNYEYFQNMLSLEISSATRYMRELALLLIDIDHFKQFNDTWGHQLGDLVLKEVAQSIKETCRSSDVVARYGGEEMAVILPSTEKNVALDVAERIRSNIESLEIDYQGQQLKVTVSVGVALLEDNAEDKQQLIQRADEALYRSKHTGRNQVSIISCQALPDAHKKPAQVAGFDKH